MLFHPPLHSHIAGPAAKAPWLLRLTAIVLGGLLLWAYVCSATHGSDSHTHGRTAASSGPFLLTADAVEREMSPGPHPHGDPVCPPYVVSHVLPQAGQLFAETAALAALAGVAAGVTAAAVVRLLATWPAAGRTRIRRSGRSTLSVVCRWRI